MFHFFLSIQVSLALVCDIWVHILPACMDPYPRVVGLEFFVTLIIVSLPVAIRNVVQSKVRENLANAKGTHELLQ